MNAVQRPPARDPRGPSEDVARRDRLARTPSRPRYESGARANRVDTAMERADRQRIAQIIREPRKRKGMMQSEASKALGVPQTMLSAWERGKQTVPAEMRLKIALLYGIDPRLFEGLDIASVAITDDERVMLNRFRAATDGERRAALKAVCP